MFLNLGVSYPETKNLRSYGGFLLLGISIIGVFFCEGISLVLFKYGWKSTNDDVRRLIDLKYCFKARRSVHDSSKFVAIETGARGTVDGVSGSPWLGIITKTT